MKILLTTLNSKYIHSALSLQYIYGCCKGELQDISIEEYTINHSLDYILAEIYKGQYDIVCFSCYIWNISSILQIVHNLKKVCPKLVIVLGGPEVSFDPVQLMEKYFAIDYIIVGEGEITIRELINHLTSGEGNINKIDGIVHRFKGKAVKNQDRALIKDLNTVPSPYGENMDAYENKIIYYESSRGCPYNCKYCLSSTIKGVRFFPLDRVKRDMDRFLKNRVKQVKFVDRTFNAKKSHSLEIMKYLVENDNGFTNFHFEITADLLDQEILEFLSTVREGLFQFEVGVQTTYEQTMKSIDRSVDFDILSNVIRKISSFKNIHLHLDLIAGLPFETYERFKFSFDDVYRLKPEKLQLGFLKLLKGSAIRSEKDEHGYIFHDEPPYEVMENKYLSYSQLLKLKMMEEMVELYYNSHGFTYSIDYIITNYFSRPSYFYEALAGFWEKKGYHHFSHGKNELYKILMSFYNEEITECNEIFHELLKLDYLRQGKSSLPDFLISNRYDSFQNKIHQFLQDEKNIQKYLPKYEGMTAKQIIKKVHFENFKYDVIDIVQNSTERDYKEKDTAVLFDYDVESIFNKSRFFKVPV